MKLLNQYGIASILQSQQKYIKEFNIFPDSIAKIEKLEKRVAEIIAQDEEFRASLFDFKLYPQSNVFRLYAYKMIKDEDLRNNVRQYALFLGSQAVIDYITKIDGSYSVSINILAKRLDFISLQHDSNKNYDALFKSFELYTNVVTNANKEFSYIKLDSLIEDLEAQPELLCAYVKKHYKIDIEPAIVERLIQSPTRRTNILDDIKEHVRQANALQVADFNDFGM